MYPKCSAGIDLVVVVAWVVAGCGRRALVSPTPAARRNEHERKQEHANGQDEATLVGR